MRVVGGECFIQKQINPARDQRQGRGCVHHDAVRCGIVWNNFYASPNHRKVPDRPAAPQGSTGFTDDVSICDGLYTKPEA